MTLPRRWLLMPALALATFALIACSGGEETDPTPTGTTAAQVTPAAATATAESTPQFAAQSPQDLQSYRYRVNVTVAAEALDDSEAPTGLDLDGNLTLGLEGAVVNPDREHTSTAIDIGFLTLSTETVRVGDQEWTRAGQGAWSASTSGEGAEALFDADFSPASIFTTSADFDYEALTARLEEHGWKDEEVNGVRARHYSFTEEEFYSTFETDEAVLPADIDATFTADIWLAEDLGVPVRMLIVGVDGAGTEILRLEMDVTDINSQIAIDPPV